MSILKRTLILAGCMVALGLGTASVMAQGGANGGNGGNGGGNGGGRGRRGGGNPQAMLDAYRTRLGVTDNDEWTAISAKITALQEAQAAARGFGGGGRGRRGAGGGPGGGGGGAPTPTDAEAALQKAIDDKAQAPEIKTKLAAVHAERAAKTAAAQAAYVKAQDDLRGLLTARQEAILTLRGEPDPNAGGGGGGGFGGFGVPPLFPD